MMQVTHVSLSVCHVCGMHDECMTDDGHGLMGCTKGCGLSSVVLIVICVASGRVGDS
jgi:hypothetical protein